MTDQEITKIAEKVKEAIGSEIKPFYVDREIHYQHHQFMGSFMEFMNKTQSIVLKTVVTAIVLGAIGLVVLGFIIWGRGKFN